MNFSVIIPTYNRSKSLEKTLQSVLRQSFEDYEIIVVNDGSTDDTDTLLRRYEEEPNLVYLRQENKGPSSARNAGIKTARGEYIAFTDDDCIVPADWLKLFASAFERTHTDALGGAAVNCIQNNFFSALSQEITNHFVVTLAGENISTAFLTSNNVAYRTKLLKELSGFDERFTVPGGEERALHWKIIAHGGTCLYAPEIIIEHYHDMTFGKFLRQQWNYGRGAAILYSSVDNSVGKETSVVKPIPFSVYLSLISKFFKSGLFVGWLKTKLFVLGQVVVACGFINETLFPAGGEKISK